MSQVLKTYPTTFQAIQDAMQFAEKCLKWVILHTVNSVIDNAIQPTVKELYKLDNRPVGSKALDELIDEDRGEY